MNQGLPLPSLKEFCLHRFNPEFAPDRWSELNHFEESILTISHPTCQPHYHHPQQKRRILRPTNSKLIETNLFCCIPSIPRASNYLTQASNTCKMCFTFSWNCEMKTSMIGFPIIPLWVWDETVSGENQETQRKSEGITCLVWNLWRPCLVWLQNLNMSGHSAPCISIKIVLFCTI